MNNQDVTIKTIRAEMPRRVAETLAVVCFLIVFPGYYFYHYFAAAGLIPLLIRGWFILGCFATAASLGLAFLLTRPFPGPQLAVHAMFGVLAAMIAGSAAYHYFWGEDFQRGPDIAINVIITLASFIALYLLGYFASTTSALRVTTTFSLLAMATLAIGSIDPTTLQFIAIKRFNAPAGVAEYQGFALAFVTTALMALGLNWNSRLEPLILATGFTTLLILGSRSDFYGYAVVATGWVILLIIKKRYLTAATGIGASAILTVVVLLLPPKIAHEPPPEPSVATSSGPNDASRRSSDYTLDIARQTAIVDISQSESWSFRKQMLARGWDDIKASPFWGVYAGQTKDGGSMGSYIHNGLSAWRQFGLLALLIYVALCAAPPLIAAYQVVLRGEQDRLWLSTLYFGTFCLLLVVVAKAIFWPLPALAWGLLAGRLAQDQSQLRNGCAP